MSRILLTGSSGFIGSNLAEYLAKNHTVLTPSHKQLDLLNESAVDLYLISNTPEHVIHCANDKLNGLNSIKMFRNLQKYHNQYCTGKVITFGSGAEYDRHHWKGGMEEANIGDFMPSDDYGFSKYIINQLVKEGHQCYNLRLFGLYGPNENRLISTLCKNILNDEDIVLENNLKFDYLYINDLCKIVEKFLDIFPIHYDYNVCTGKSIEFQDIAIKLLNISGKTSNIKNLNKYFPYKEYGGTNHRLLEEIPFEFTPIEQGLKELYDYYSIRTVK